MPASPPRPRTPPPAAPVAHHPAPSPASQPPAAKRARGGADADDLAPSTAAPAMADPATATAVAADSAQQQQQAVLAVKLLDKEGAKAPTRGSAFAAGYDLYASAAATVPAHGRALVSTGIAIAVPAGTYARIAPRSGLAVKHGIATGAGVVDEDYRGEVKVVLFNHGDADFAVAPGDRIAQMVLERIVTPDVAVVETLAESVRGAGGFGSTGGFGGAV